MFHPLYRATKFERLGGHRLRVHFDDATSREIDFRPAAHGELYGPLADPGEFAGVEIDPVAGTLVWPCGADFDPAILHDWPLHAASFQQSARVREEPPARPPWCG